MACEKLNIDSMRPVKTVQPLNIYRSLTAVFTALRGVVRFQCLEICAKRQARPIEVHAAAVGDDLALFERGRFAGAALGSSFFFT